MKTPSFLKDRTLTQRDLRRLSPTLCSWNTLNEAFKSNTLTNQDLNMLILIEINNCERMQILNKLIQRRNSNRRREELEEIKDLIGEYIDVRK